MGRMHNPPHPGGMVKISIEHNDLSIAQAAKKLGVTRQALYNLVNEKTAMTPAMAMRVAKVFGGTPEIHLRVQIAYDLWQLRDMDLSDVEEMRERASG